MQLETLLSAAQSALLPFDPAALEAARAAYSRWSCEAASTLRAAGLPVPAWPDALATDEALNTAIAGSVLTSGRWCLSFDARMRPQLSPLPAGALVLRLEDFAGVLGEVDRHVPPAVLADVLQACEKRLDRVGEYQRRREEEEAARTAAEAGMREQIGRHAFEVTGPAGDARLKLFTDGVEVGGGRFDGSDAHIEAAEEGWAWLQSREAEDAAPQFTRWHRSTLAGPLDLVLVREPLDEFGNANGPPVEWLELSLVELPRRGDLLARLPERMRDRLLHLAAVPVPTDAEPVPGASLAAASASAPATSPDPLLLQDLVRLRPLLLGSPAPLSHAHGLSRLFNLDGHPWTFLPQSQTYDGGRLELTAHVRALCEWLASLRQPVHAEALLSVLVEADPEASDAHDGMASGLFDLLARLVYAGARAVTAHDCDARDFATGYTANALAELEHRVAALRGPAATTATGTSGNADDLGTLIDHARGSAVALHCMALAEVDVDDLQRATSAHCALLRHLETARQAGIRALQS